MRRDSVRHSFWMGAFMPKNPLSNHFQVVLSVVMVALTIGLTLVEAWGQSGPSKIIIAPTDQYYPKPYWSVRNWDNRLGFDPIFEGKVAFYKEKGLPIEWDPEVGNFVVKVREFYVIRVDRKKE